jgi:hypothetical protein
MHSRKNFPVLFSFTTYYRLCNKDRVTRTPLKPGGELRCSGRISSSCSTSGTRRGNIVTQPVISREWEKEVLYVYFVDRCLSFFFWPLCCLFFFDMRILIAPLVYSNSSNESSTSFRKAVWLYNQGNYPIFPLTVSYPQFPSNFISHPNLIVSSNNDSVWSNTFICNFQKLTSE